MPPIPLQNMDALKKFDRKLTDPVFWQQMVKSMTETKKKYVLFTNFIIL
jgi:hypothetical protein